jgi:hypothetical protein
MGNIVLLDVDDDWASDGKQLFTWYVPLIWLGTYGKYCFILCG